MQTHSSGERNSWWTILGTVLAFAVMSSVVATAQVERIDATARGTSTQMGKIISIKIIINQFSTPEDRQALADAFKKGQNQGLADALSKMKSSGRIQIPGTVGYDLAYVVAVPTPTGRKIRFVTNRKIAFGEVARNTQSQAFSLTAGEIDVNEQDIKKSSGVLYPATQLTVNSEGGLTWQLNQNPWQLTNIIDWKPKGKE
jgi:hypothetical protein